MYRQSYFCLLDGVLCAVTHTFAYWTSPVSVVHIIFFIIRCGIMRFLCAVRMLCMYSTSGHHTHSLSYLCAKFSFCPDLNCWASPCRKTAYSINHSLTQLIWCAGNGSLCFRKTCLYSTQIWPVLARGSHSFTCHPLINHTYLYSPAAKHHRPLADTHCAYPRSQRWFYH